MSAPDDSDPRPNAKASGSRSKAGPIAAAVVVTVVAAGGGVTVAGDGNPLNAFATRTGTVRQDERGAPPSTLYSVPTPLDGPPPPPSALPTTPTSATAPAPDARKPDRIYDGDHKLVYGPDARGFDEGFNDEGYSAANLSNPQGVAVHVESKGGLNGGGERNHRLPQSSLQTNPRPDGTPEPTIPYGIEAKLKFAPGGTGYVEYALTHGSTNEHRLGVQIGNNGIEILSDGKPVTQLPTSNPTAPVTAYFYVDEGVVGVWLTQDGGKTSAHLAVGGDGEDPYIGTSPIAKSSRTPVDGIPTAGHSALDLVSEYGEGLEQQRALSLREAVQGRGKPDFDITPDGVVLQGGIGQGH